MEILPCKKCGSTEIEIGDCNYSSFNVGGGTCRGCKNASNGTVGTFPTQEEMIRIWNSGQRITDVEVWAWLQAEFEGLEEDGEITLVRGESSSLRDLLVKEMRKGGIRGE